MLGPRALPACCAWRLGRHPGKDQLADGRRHIDSGRIVTGCPLPVSGDRAERSRLVYTGKANGSTDVPPNATGGPAEGNDNVKGANGRVEQAPDIDSCIVGFVRTAFSNQWSTVVSDTGNRLY